MKKFNISLNTDDCSYNSNIKVLAEDITEATSKVGILIEATNIANIKSINIFEEPTAEARAEAKRKYDQEKRDRND